MLDLEQPKRIHERREQAITRQQIELLVVKIPIFRLKFLDFRN